MNTWLKRGLVLGVCIPACAFAAELKLAIVDPRIVFAKMPQREAVAQNLNKEFQVRGDELRKLGQEIQGMVDKGNKEAPVMSEQQKTELKRKIEGKQADLQLKQNALREDAMRREEEEKNKLLQQIQEAINNIAKQDKYSAVLTRDAVPYVGDLTDITDKVLQNIGKATPKP